MYRVKLRTKDTGVKNCKNPDVTITHDWQDIEALTPELTDLKRWGEILIEKKTMNKKEEAEVEKGGDPPKGKVKTKKGK